LMSLCGKIMNKSHLAGVKEELSKKCKYGAIVEVESRWGFDVQESRSFRVGRKRIRHHSRHST
jgi:hypothetical protein